MAGKQTACPTHPSSQLHTNGGGHVLFSYTKLPPKGHSEGCIFSHFLPPLPPGRSWTQTILEGDKHTLIRPQYNWLPLNRYAQLEGGRRGLLGKGDKKDLAFRKKGPVTVVWASPIICNESFLTPPLCWVKIVKITITDMPTKTGKKSRPNHCC